MNPIDYVDAFLSFWESLLFGATGTEGNTQPPTDEPATMDPISVPPIDKTFDNVAPDFASKVKGYMEAAKEKGYELYILETHRTHERQAWIYGQGRPDYEFNGVHYGRDGKTITNAKPGQSKHEETPGRAVDTWVKGVGFDAAGNAKATLIFGELADLRAAYGLKNLPSISDYDHLEDA